MPSQVVKELEEIGNWKVMLTASRTRSSSLLFTNSQAASLTDGWWGLSKQGYANLLNLPTGTVCCS